MTNYTQDDINKAEQEAANAPQINEIGGFEKPGMLSRVGDWVGDVFAPERTGGSQYENQYMAWHAQEQQKSQQANDALEANKLIQLARQQDMKHASAAIKAVDDLSGPNPNPNLQGVPTQVAPLQQSNDSQVKVLAATYNEAIARNDPQAAALALQNTQRQLGSNDIEEQRNVLTAASKSATTTEAKEQAEKDLETLNQYAEGLTEYFNKPENAPQVTAGIIGDIAARNGDIAFGTRAAQSKMDAADAKLKEHQTLLERDLALSNLDPARAKLLNERLGTYRQLHEEYATTSKSYKDQIKAQRNDVGKYWGHVQRLLSDKSIPADQKPAMYRDAREAMISHGVNTWIAEHPNDKNIPESALREYIGNTLTQQGVPPQYSEEAVKGLSKQTAEYASVLESAEVQANIASDAHKNRVAAAEALIKAEEAKQKQIEFNMKVAKFQQDRTKTALEIKALKEGKGTDAGKLYDQLQQNVTSSQVTFKDANIQLNVDQTKLENMKKDSPEYEQQLLKVQQSEDEVTRARTIRDKAAKDLSDNEVLLKGKFKPKEKTPVPVDTSSFGRVSKKAIDAGAKDMAFLVAEYQKQYPDANAEEIKAHLEYLGYIEKLPSKPEQTLGGLIVENVAGDTFKKVGDAFKKGGKYFH